MAIIFAGKVAEMGTEEDIKFESNLISLVKFFPCIYDTSHPDYNNMRKNNFAWAKMSNSLQKPVIECINKWYALLQLFLSLQTQIKEEDTSTRWHHFYAMLKVAPKTPLTYAQLVNEKPPFVYSEPVALQKEILIRQMEVNGKELLSPYISIEQKQKIWLQIAQKLNSFNIRVTMPIIKWQKYWIELKRAVIEAKRKILFKPHLADDRKNETIYFPQDDIKILNIFGVKYTDTLDKITLALSGSMEIDSDMEKFTKCCRCNKSFRNIQNKTYCDACHKVSKSSCDLCSRVNQFGLIVLRVCDWIGVAKTLLPSHLASFSSITACGPCLRDLKRHAGEKWLACRVCENYNPPFDNLFSTENTVLRKAFGDATNIMFCETDGLPHYICKVCKVQMQQFNNFYLKYIRVQKRLADIQEEFFIGVNGIVLPNCQNNNMKVAVKKLTNIRSGLNALSESGNTGEGSNTNTAEVKKFTIVSSSPQSRSIQITGTKKISQTVVPIGALAPNVLQQDVGPCGVPSSSPPVINAVVPDQQTPVILQKPSTLQIIKGLPPGTNVKSRRVIPAASVKAQQLSPVKIQREGPPSHSYMPTKPLIVKSVSSSASSKDVALTPVNVKPHLPITTITAKQKPIQIKSVTKLPNTPSVCGIINKITNAPPTSSITFKTKSGTTTLSTSSKFPLNNPRVSTVPTLTSTVALVQKRPVETVEQTPPTVFKIPDDIYDPNSPPAFCIPKSASQAQNMAMSGFKTIPGNSQTNETPQNATPAQIIPQITPAVVNPPEIKTEIVDEVEFTGNNGPMEKTTPNSNPAVNNIPMIQIHTTAVADGSAHSSTGFQAAFQSPLVGKSQFYANTTTTARPKVDSGLDSGVKKQQQSVSLPGPSTGNKRPRKYWGAVDEFHIPLKIANQNQTINESCPEIEIKEEQVDPDDANKDMESRDNEASANTFYSDSFDLGSVSLDAHVTDVLKHILAHHQSVQPDSYQFTNSSLMTACNEKSSSSNRVDLGHPSESDLNVAKGRGSITSSTSTITAECEANVKDGTDANDQSRQSGESTASGESKARGESRASGESKARGESRASGESKARGESRASGDSKASGQSSVRDESRENDESKANGVAEAQSECKRSKESKTRSIGKTLNLRELKLKIDKAKIIPKENKTNSNLAKSKKFHVKNLRIKLKRNRNLQTLALGAARSKVAPRSCTNLRRKSDRHRRH